MRHVFRSYAVWMVEELKCLLGIRRSHIVRDAMRLAMVNGLCVAVRGRAPKCALARAVKHGAQDPKRRSQYRQR